MNEDLPSVNDFIRDESSLPSVNDFIEPTPSPVQESVEPELPSYKDFIFEDTTHEEMLEEADRREQENDVEESEPQQTVIREQTIIREVQDNSAIISLIESVRNSIPEVKSYDKELYDLMHLIEELRRDIPEIKSYDKEIQELKESIPSIPVVKYYDKDIESLKESINEVKDRYIPDFRWIYRSFSQLDEGQENLVTSLSEMKNRLDMEINNLVESMDVVKFETNIDIKSLGEKVEELTSTEKNLIETIGETKDKIYKELRETSLRIWNLKKELQEDDSKLKKELGSQYKKLGESLNEILEGQEEKYSKVNIYLRGLKEEISNLPEVKYYDQQIDEVNQSVEDVRSLVGILEDKLNEKIEDLRKTIPEKSEVVITESDPLTPLDQNFATLDDLSNHYKLFINRIQTQLASIGGGGETRLEFLDDIDRDTVLVDGKVIAYQASTGKFIGVTNSGGGGGGGIANTSDVRDAIQGYYGYTTDYYTVGVANTTQEVGAGETTMIMPQVAAVYQYLPTVMSGVNTNPYVGTGATIGTGQTEFSLAGLGSGASCIVRTALAFNPDDDNTNLDVQLKFTTNTATQAGGLTNFTIKKEQALIMNEGADQQYISENLFSFFVGDTLQGTTQSNAGSFSVEVVPSSDGELEVLAVTVNIVA